MTGSDGSGTNTVAEDTGYRGGEVWDRPKPETRVNIDTEIIDCDAHIIETVDDVLPYMENDEAASYMASGYFDYPNYDGWDRSAGGRIATRTVRGPDTQTQVMEDLSLDTVILTPTKQLHLGKVTDREFANGLSRGFNNYMLAEWLDADDRFKSGIFLPPLDPEFAAEEIDRLADEDGFVCAFLNPAGPEKALGDERYDPIYRAAEKYDLPLAMHGGATTFPTFPMQTNYFHKFIEVHSFSHPIQQLVQTMSILCRGVPVRFPDIRFVSMEAGLSWLPMLTRLDTEFMSRPNEAPLLERPPSEYFADHFWITSQPLEEYENAMDLVEYAGGFENILFSTDWPHWDFDSPVVVQQHFPEDQWESIYSENAKEAFPRL